MTKNQQFIIFARQLLQRIAVKMETAGMPKANSEMQAAAHDMALTEVCKGIARFQAVETPEDLRQANQTTPFIHGLIDWLHRGQPWGHA